MRNPPYFAQKIIECSAFGFGAITAFLWQENIFSKAHSQETKDFDIKVPEIKDHHLLLDFHDPPFLPKAQNLAFENNKFKKGNNGRHFIYYVPRFDMKAPSNINNLFTYWHIHFLK